MLIAEPAAACAAGLHAQCILRGAGDVAREHLAKGSIRYLLTNARQRQCRTGVRPGLRAARETCRLLAGMAGCAMSQVLPFSTGVIGQDLPVDPFAQAVPTCCPG